MIQCFSEIYHCPSGDESHSVTSKNQFIQHLTVCPTLKQLSDQQGSEMKELQYYVCPRNFFHLKLVELSSMKNNQFGKEPILDFCKCTEDSQNYLYSNCQGRINICQQNMVDYFKFVYQMDINLQQNVDQDSVTSSHLESYRNQYLKGQNLKKNIEQNRILCFTFCDDLYEHKAEFRFVKDHQGMKQYLQMHQRIDQHFEILPSKKVNLIYEDIRYFISSSMKQRIIMEVQLSQMNSIRVQKFFEKDNFYTCVSYKEDILLMFRYKTFMNNAISPMSLFLMKLERNEYMNYEEIEKSQRLSELSNIVQRNPLSSLDQYYLNLQHQEQKAIKKENEDLYFQKYIRQENEQYLFKQAQEKKNELKEETAVILNTKENEPEKVVKKQLIITKINKSQIKDYNLQNSTKNKRKIIPSASTNRCTQQQIEEYNIKIFELNQKFEKYESQLQFFQRIKKYQLNLEIELKCLESDLKQKAKQNKL